MCPASKTDSAVEPPRAAEPSGVRSGTSPAADLLQPGEQLAPRYLAAVDGTLRAVVAVQCFAMAARWFAAGLETPIAGVLFFEWGWSESATLWVESLAAWAMAAAAVFTLLRPCWPVLFPVAAWMALIPWAAWQRDEGFVPWLEPFEQSIRYLAPLALALLNWYPPRRPFSLARATAAMWLLRIGTAATFIGHGLVALWHNPHFVDLCLTADDSLLHGSLTESNARAILTVIGVADIALGLNIIWARLPAVALWMACWGFITAGSRIVYYGLADGYIETAIRIANGGAPLVIALWWLLAVRTRQTYEIRT